MGMNRERGIGIKIVLQNRIIENPETRIEAKAQRKQTIRRVRFHFVIVCKKEEHNYHGCNRQFEASVGAYQSKLPLMPSCQSGIQQHNAPTHTQNAPATLPDSPQPTQHMPSQL